MFRKENPLPYQFFSIAWPFRPKAAKVVKESPRKSKFSSKISPTNTVLQTLEIKWAKLRNYSIQNEIRNLIYSDSDIWPSKYVYFHMLSTEFKTFDPFSRKWPKCRDWSASFWWSIYTSF